MKIQPPLNLKNTKSILFLAIFWALGSFVLFAQTGPGGVSNNLQGWWKADGQVYSDEGTTLATNSDPIYQWSDFSPNGNNFIQVNSGERPIFIAATLNFNPQATFDGSEFMDGSGTTGLPNGNSARFMRLVTTSTASFTGNHVPFAHGTGTQDQAHVVAGSVNSNSLIYGSWEAVNDITSPNFWTLDQPHIIGGGYDGVSNTYLQANGTTLETRDGARPTWNTVNSLMRIGADVATTAGEFWTGNIAEVLVYDTYPTLIEQQQIDSYLALKYGISLDQTSDLDYLASDGSIIWDASNNTGYKNDIFGIGRDDNSSLNQKVSKSVNTGAILTIALDTNFTKANTDANRTTEHDNDKQFLIVSNNGGATTTQTTELESSTGFNIRLAREWKIDATNFSQNISLKFEGYDDTWSIVTKADGDFSSEVSTLGTLNADGEFTTTTALADGSTFTLAKFQKAPGGIPSALTLWLKADEGVTTDTGTSIDQWGDQSGKDYDFTDSDGNEGPDLVSGVNGQFFNFNDYVSHAAAGTTARSLKNSSSLGMVGTDEATLFSVIHKNGINQTIFTAKDTSGKITQLTVNGGYIDGNDFGQFIPGSNAPDNQTIVGGVRDEIPSDNQQEGIFNGNITNDTNSGMQTLNDFENNTAVIGTNGTKHYQGLVAEIIVYQEKLSDADVQKVSSYLALKYGVALDQTTATDYLASDGTVFWDASENTEYKNNIFGIGRDDASGLNQKVSKSVNSGSILTMALDANFTASNTDASRTTEHGNDKQFLIISNNGGAITNTYAEIAGTNYNSHISKVWKTNATTNFSQSVNLKFNGFDETWALLKDDDGDFSSGASSLGTLDSNGEITGVVLANVHFLTLAKVEKGPGGITSNMALWLRADSGIVLDTGVSIWEDQSLGQNNPVQAIANSQPIIGSETINFNPKVSFDGSNDMMNFDNDLGLTGTNAYTIFGIMNIPNAGSKTAILATDGCGDGFAWYQESVGAGSGLIGITQCGTTAAFGNAVIANETTLRTATRAINGGHDFYKEGGNKVTDIGLNFASQNMALGNTNGIYSDIHLSELIVFNTELSETERQKVHTYLSLKYGVTLDQTSGIDYLASDGTVIWDASNNTGYKTDIFGIGRDDASGLNQKISKSVNEGSILTAALDDNFTLANNDNSRNTLHANDKQFLVISNNGGATTTQTTELQASTGFNIRLGREWKINATNFSQNISLKFDGYDESWSVIATDNGDFSSGVTVMGALNASGVLTTTAPLGNGKSFTLARVQEAPGGINTNLTFWVKANEGTNITGTGVVSTWADQSGNGYDLSEAVSNQGPQYNANGMNFNPVSDFVNVSNGHMSTSLNINPDALDPKQIYIVYDLDGNPAHPLMGNDDSNYDTMIGPDGINGNGTTETAHSAEATSDRPHILVADLNHSVAGGSFARVDGQQFSGFTYDNANGGTPETALGKGLLTDVSTFQGNIAEAIIYGGGTLPSGTTRQQIESYLALKYGISLDQTSPLHYLASDGTIIWDASNNSGYKTDIFGIGRDDASALNQKISRSANNDNSPILATTTDFMSSNLDGSRTGLSDGNFMVMGHNNGAENSFTSSFNGGTNNRSDRVWKVDETGTVGDVYFAVPYEAATFPSGGTPAVVISNNESFDDQDQVVLLTYDRSKGGYYAKINPADGDYLALAISDISVAIPAYYRTRSDNQTDGITKYSSYADFIAHTNGVFTGFTQTWSFGDSFFADGVYFYRTNNINTSVTRYPSLADLAAGTNGIVYNFTSGGNPQDWNDNDEFFASGDLFFRTASSTGTHGLSSYPSFADLLANTNETPIAFSSTFRFEDQFFHDGQYFLRTNTNTTDGQHKSVTRYASLNDLANDLVFDTQPFGPFSLNDDIFAVGITAGFTVSETALTIAENAGTGTFTVVLDAQPANDAVFDIASDDIDEATVFPSTLTFTSANWNVPQTVTVTGVDDHAIPNDSATITVSVNADASDDTFDSLGDQTIAVTLTDVEAISPVFTSPTAAYNVSVAQYSGTFFDVSSEVGSPYSIDFSANGNKMFVSGIDSNVIAEYSLSTAFDVSTATYNTSLTGMSDRTTGINFNNNGTTLYFVGAGSSANVVEYGLSDPYDLASATQTQTYVASQASSYKDVTFNNDGTKMYLLADNTHVIYEYSLGVAYDISTSTYTSNSYTITEHERPMELDFNSDGTQLFIVADFGQILAYDLSTPFDLSSISYNSIAFDISSQEPNAYGMAFSEGGEKFYVIGFSKNVYEYDMLPVVEYAENGTNPVVDIDANNGNGGANDEGITYALATGGDNDLFSIDAATGALTFQASPDFEDPQDADTDNNYEITVTATDNDGDTVQHITISVTDVDEPPVISNFSPIAAGNGETVTINGSNFLGTTEVNFGDTAATSFTVVSNTEITAVVGTGASGDITVTSPGGNDTETGFIYKVAQYDFEGNPDDATENNYDGTEVNTITYNTGAQGQAVCFDNGPGFVKLPDNLIRSLSEFTISLRFKTTGTGSILGYQNVQANVSNNPSNYIPILLITSDGKLKGTLWTSTSTSIQAISSSTVNDGNWHQVDFTAGTNSVSIYLDGSLEANTTGAAVAHLDMIYNQLGFAHTNQYNLSATTWEYFNGCIDDMVIFDRKLTEAEIETVTELPEPTVISFDPVEAGQEDTVVITGTNFDGATQVTFGGIDAASYTVDSSTQITAVLGNTAASGDVEVVTAGGTATLSGFTFTSKTNITTSVSSLNSIIYCGGETSSALDFDVSASDAYQDMVISAPSGFEISLNENSGFVSSLILSPVANTIVNTTIYVRVAAGQSGRLSGNVAIVSGTVAENISVNAETNNSLYFDGIDDYVNLTSITIPDGASDFTIEAWILPDNSNWDGDYHAIMGNQQGAIETRNPSFYIIDGKIHIDSYEDNTLTRFPFLETNPSILQNVWSHIALVKDGLQFIVYVNGQEVITAPAPGAINITAPYQFGFIDNYFAGKIDDVRFWSDSRTASEITNNMNTALMGNEAGLIGHYNFNEGVTEGNNIGLTTLPDNTASANDGTLNNFALSGTTSNWVQGYFSQISGENTTAIGGQIQLTHLESGGVWSSNNTNIATVNQSGLVTGVATGTANITYQLCGQSTFKTVEVKNSSPTITSFTPTSAETGDNVVITGTNFNGTTQVTFGGTNAASFTVDSSTQITAVVDEGTSGSIVVTTTVGTATTTGFTYLYPDTDEDGVRDDTDNCTSIANADQTDTDADGDGNACDDDDDNDGTPDVDDAFPLDENEDTDTDGDGTGDNADTDDDGDGTPDAQDAFPLDENEDTDTDGDGTGDNADTDDDNDGTPDTDDAFPLDENEDTDTDGDGTGDNADTDDDGDGTPDTDDAFPLDENEDTDTDGDGTGDNADTDDDNDGTPDTDDAFPLDDSEDTDTDGDGTGDNADTDDDGDGTPDTEDAFPLDDSEDTDTDGDGTGNNADTDDDGDGTPDVDDAFPLDDSEDTDTDGDGTGDNTDDDIDGDGIPNDEDLYPNGDVEDADNDGVPDSEDAFPNDPNESVDSDGDGQGDNSDPDDDNDGTPDTEDAFPLDNSEDTDTDGDGTGDNNDNDIDGDGIPNDEDIYPNGQITDTDNDGVPDSEDALPNDPNESVDSDGDGIGDNADPDDDNDGVPDTEDAFPWDPTEDTDTDGDGTGDNADNDDDNDGIPDSNDDFPMDGAPRIIPAQAFTPNGDGNNDTWIVPGIGNYPNNVVRVYNRSGHEVFAVKGYENDWTGSYKDNREKLPAGSYLYVIDLGDGSAPLQGWIFINY
ncbi:LamG-like jellyroll fold domain-containing protein [Maribacter cobaltidurans]|uniref:Uncharacterized protein n=1 Tax=Maribacter cobaltidurans TaxID=1178778 RepID=A0A223V8S0_9FLAO|nr:LamG-like jellyroll fold domain-containing protein [Maribacter cobaltidurans]ASV31702.1 hypothetical protein CJ263_16600 [Maribacter cobaltidurans]GGD93643.1 hypothetical protein GCM10011412_34580 [Maribacter cobaltidurans]